MAKQVNKKQEFVAYDRAIEALEKPSTKVRKQDRAAVAALMQKLRNDLNASGSRVQHFETTLTVAAILGKDAGARLVHNNLHKLPSALDAFAEGKAIGKLQEAAIAYIKRWRVFVEGERQMYDDFTSLPFPNDKKRRKLFKLVGGAFS